ncbi:7314_t:CDS:2, partial [Entrophospora sp. SA101]
KTLSAFSTDATTSKKRKISEDEDLKEKITPITDFEDDRSRSSDSKREKKISRRSKHSSNNDKMSIDDGNGDDGLIAKELSIGYLRDRITNTGHHQYQLESNKEQVSALETFKNQIQSCPDEEWQLEEIRMSNVMNTNSNIANPNIIMTEKCELLQNALTTTASTFLDSNFNNLFGSCGGGVESQLYQTSSFLPPKSNDRYLQLYAAGNIITGNGNDLSSESDDMIIEKYMNCNDFSNGSKEIETIRSEFDSIIAEVMKE